MITSAVIYGLSLIPLALLIALNLTPVTSLVIAGISFDATLILYASYFYSFTQVFWPLQPVLNVLILYIPFKITMTILRAVIGNRVPDSS